MFFQRFRRRRKRDSEGLESEINTIKYEVRKPGALKPEKCPQCGGTIFSWMNVDYCSYIGRHAWRCHKCMAIIQEVK